MVRLAAGQRDNDFTRAGGSGQCHGIEDGFRRIGLIELHPAFGSASLPATDAAGGGAKRSLGGQRHTDGGRCQRDVSGQRHARGGGQLHTHLRHAVLQLPGGGRGGGDGAGVAQPEAIVQGIVGDGGTGHTGGSGGCGTQVGGQGEVSLAATPQGEGVAGDARPVEFRAASPGGGRSVISQCSGFRGAVAGRYGGVQDAVVGKVTRQHGSACGAGGDAGEVDGLFLRRGRVLFVVASGGKQRQGGKQEV